MMTWLEVSLFNNMKYFIIFPFCEWGYITYHKNLLEKIKHMTTLTKEQTEEIYKTRCKYVVVIYLLVTNTFVHRAMKVIAKW